MERKKEVFVIGHKNPDTDSICSSIAYAYIKNQRAKTSCYVPKRAGEINTETAYVLEHFGHKAPAFVENVKTQVSDASLHPGECVDKHISLHRAWEILNDRKRSTLAVLDPNQRLEGLITIGDIAKSIMDVHDSRVLADAKTPYENIIDTLEAEVLVGDVTDQYATGKIIIAAANPDLLEDCIEPGDMVIVGDRYESQLCAIEMQAACLIVCINSPVRENILKMAESSGCKIIRTAYDTFITARLLNQSIPVSYFMIKDKLLTFRQDDYIDNIRSIMAKVRHRDFPVLDEKGRFVGMMTRQSLLQMSKKRIILVDHNEAGQAVDGIQDAELEEIVDHHKIGAIETLRPVTFRNMPVGCTSTILYLFCKERGLEIPADIAGLMCSAIISDTLLFRSPTCTPVDRSAAEELAKISNVDLESHAKAMFTAGSNLGAKTEKEILYQDFKVFKTGDFQYGVGQISSMDADELKATVPRMTAFIQQELQNSGLDMIYFMLTDILEESTRLICVGDHAVDYPKTYGKTEVAEDGCLELPGVVSRKKQLIPMLIHALSIQL